MKDLNHCFKNALKSSREKINISIEGNCVWSYSGIKSLSTSHSNKLKCQI